MNYTFRRLVIGRKSDGRAVSVVAPRETCDFYGWSDSFEVWTPRQVDLGNGRMGFQFTKARAMNGDSGGKRFRISRSPSRDGFPAGFTNQFRIMGGWRQIDLIELAKATQVDWYWLMGPTGHKWSREQLVQDRLIGLTQ